ncbi:MAG: hypothetical protein QGH20_09370 [Candidatus Latescibacteria bacterium]|jgi:hypothetical protein|nr:hypothetical protein [Candidatus Latescibacterota bacterium]
MKVTLWGCRGSLPTPLPNNEIEEKLHAVLEARDLLGNDVDHQVLIDSLPFHQRATFGGKHEEHHCEIEAAREGMTIDI